MTTQSKESIEANLDLGLQNGATLHCILKSGLPETVHIRAENPVLYHLILFAPNFEFDGWYTGYMFYPDGKNQGLMDFNVDSFWSVVYPQE